MLGDVHEEFARGDSSLDVLVLVVPPLGFLLPRPIPKRSRATTKPPMKLRTRSRAAAAVVAITRGVERGRLPTGE